MLASWYCLEGQTKANGQKMHCQELTVANNTLALGTRLKLTRGSHSIEVVVDDRGPFISPRTLDTSLGVAKLLDFEREGVACLWVSRVESQPVGPRQTPPE